MAFPVSPYDGEVTLVNGIYYIYNSTDNSWTRIANTGNLVLSGILTANSIVSNTTATIAGNVNSGNVIVTGNVQGTYFLGNGSQLTGISSGISTGKAIAMAIVFGG